MRKRQRVQLGRAKYVRTAYQPSNLSLSFPKRRRGERKRLRGWKKRKKGRIGKKRKLVFAEGSFPFFLPSTVPFRIPLIPPPIPPPLSTRYLRSNPLLLPSPQVISMHPPTNPRSEEEEEGSVPVRKGNMQKRRPDRTGKEARWMDRAEKKSDPEKGCLSCERQECTNRFRDPDQFD